MIADTAQQRPPGPALTNSIKAVVLLAGAVRENDLARAARRPLVDLPLTRQTTVLSAWCRDVRAFRAEIGQPLLPLLLATGNSSSSPSPGAPAEDLLTVVPDRSDLRGTGGALRDLAERFDAGDLLLVANAHSVLQVPLAHVAGALLRHRADVVLHADRRLTPTGFMLVRVDALRGISPRGFVDFKEQALPSIAKAKSVKVAVQPDAGVMPIRTLDGYVRAVRASNQGPSHPIIDDPFAEEWTTSFGVLEDGVELGAGAQIHDSVVLSGAAIGPGAIVVRSLVCPDASVPRGAMLCDQVVAAADPEGRP